MTARNHHYLSQCYLKGFTSNGSKKSKLFGVNLKEQRTFSTRPRNVGAMRDFNRVDVEGLDQNMFESAISQFEGKVSSALENIEECHRFEGEDRELVLSLIAMLAIRRPQFREHMRQISESEARIMLNMSLASEERWRAQIKRMAADGIDISKMDYEETKNYLENNEMRLAVPRENHILMETKLLGVVLPCLLARDWLLIKATTDTGPFITCDNPVALTWIDPSRVPQMMKNSPGYGVANTQVNFPISRNLGLIGEFQGREGVWEGNAEIVAIQNTQTLQFAYEQAYGMSDKFNVVDVENKVISSKAFLKYFN